MKKSYLLIALFIQKKLPIFHLSNHRFEVWNSSAWIYCAWLIVFSLRTVPLIGKFFIWTLLNQSNSSCSKFSFCATHTFSLFVLTLPDWRATSIFSGSSQVDIVFLKTPFFSATLYGFVPDSTLYFSESDIHSLLFTIYTVM